MKQNDEYFFIQEESYCAEFSYLFYTVFIRCLRAHSSRRLRTPEYKLVLLTRI